MGENRINSLFNVHEKYKKVNIINSYRFGKEIEPLTHYKLDELSGNTIIDSQGYFNGENFGATQGLTGKINTCYGFSSGTIHSKLINSIDLIPTLTSSFSINLWLYPTSIGSLIYSERAISVFRNTALSSIVILGCDFNNQSYVYLGGARYQISTVNLNEWVMLTLTYDGTVGRTYQNGVHIGTHTQTLNGVGDPVTNIQLSKSDAGVFNGRIDDVRLWNEKIESEQINSYYF